MISSPKFHKCFEPDRQWLLSGFCSPAVESKPVKDSVGFHKRLALLLQVLLQLSGGNTASDLCAQWMQLTRELIKRRFAAGCITGPVLMPAPVGRLRSCSRWFPLACLHASNARQSKACYTYCMCTMLQCVEVEWRKSRSQVCRHHRKRWKCGSRDCICPSTDFRWYVTFKGPDVVVY